LPLPLRRPEESHYDPRFGDHANTIFTGLRINEEVIIRLKWGQTEYKGQLVSVDSYMNVQLNSTEEFINGKSTGTLGQVLIRYVAKQPSGEQ
jgi:small nuclear ribonucleoprotein (snRNP)-like protein